MDPAELLELQEAIYELSEMAPAEALPVSPLPLTGAAWWFARILRIFARHALLLAFAGAMVENTILLGFLLPGGAMVALAAAGARTADIPLPLVIFFAGAGMTAGAIIDYFLGRAGIDRLLHQPWTGRWGQRAAHELHQAAPLLRRHGWWVMLIAHAFGHGRSALAIAAGASGFSFRRFLAIECPAALLWGAIYAGGGYILAREWHTFEIVIRRAGWAGTALLAVAAIGYFLWRHRRARAPRTPSPSPVIAESVTYQPPASHQKTAYLQPTGAASMPSAPSMASVSSVSSVSSVAQVAMSTTPPSAAER